MYILFALFVLRSFAQTMPLTNLTLTSRTCQPPFDSLPFCNTSLSLDERVDDLIERIWTTNASNIPWQLTARNFGKNAFPELGLQEFDYGLNCIHGVQSSCILDSSSGQTYCPTSFMNPVNFGNAWNKSLSRELGSIIGVEARALWLAGSVEQSPRNHIGLTNWAPNINVARDPRWGRNQEVASESPLLNGDYGAEYTLGLQQGADPEYLQVAVTLKHWDAYSLEDAGGFTRHNFNAVVSNYALAHTYFPAFRKSVVEGGATGVMCSYNAVNGVPTCASPFLTKVLRDVWGFEGYVSSDSGALEDIYSQHHYVNDSLHTVAPALRDGQTDVCSGNVYANSLLPALAAGLVQREDIDLALSHVLKLRMKLGLFDPPSSTPYWSVPIKAVGTADSKATNLLATLSSMVLLKHDGKTLPIPIGKKIAVIGPHGNATQALVGNYLGQLCPDNHFDCIVSPYQALAAANIGGTTTYTQGCDLTKVGEQGFPAAIAAAQAADYVVLALGIDLSVEGESHDRQNISLPGSQHDLASAIRAVGKPIALFILRGGVVDIQGELAAPEIGAVLDAAYPGFLGGGVIASTLLGQNDHLGGKLAQTMYTNDYCSQESFLDMELDTGVGRGYRFFTGKPLLPFGHGLSLTSFSLVKADGPDSASLVTETSPSTTLTYAITVTNTGTRAGDEVVQAYFAPLSTPSQPKSKLLKELFDYVRVHLEAGAQTTVYFTVTSETLRMTDRDSGDLVSTPGSFDVYFTNGVDQSIHSNVTVTGAELTLKTFPW